MSTDPEEPADFDDDKIDPAIAADIRRAYTELNQGLSKKIGADAIQPLLDQFRLDAGISKKIGDSFVRATGDFMPAWEPPEPVRPYVLDHLPVDLGRPITADIADSTEQAVTLMKLQHEAIAQLVSLTGSSLATSARTERFTRGMAWGSLTVAVASLAAAVIAIFR